MSSAQRLDEHTDKRKTEVNADMTISRVLAFFDIRERQQECRNVMRRAK